MRRILHVLALDTCNKFCKVESKLSTLNRENEVQCYHESQGTESMKLTDPIDRLATLRDFCAQNGVGSGQCQISVRTALGSEIDTLHIDLQELRKQIGLIWAYTLKKLKMPFTFQSQSCGAVIARVNGNAIMPNYLPKNQITDILNEYGMSVKSSDGLYSNVLIDSIENLKKSLERCESIDTMTIPLESGLQIFLLSVGAH